VCGDARPDGDIDILVEVEHGRTLLDVITLEQDLEELKDDRVGLEHIRDVLVDIAAYCGSDRDGFLSDRMRQDGTLRKLEVRHRRRLSYAKALG